MRLMRSRWRRAEACYGRSCQPAGHGTDSSEHAFCRWRQIDAARPAFVLSRADKRSYNSPRALVSIPKMAVPKS